MFHVEQLSYEPNSAKYLNRPERFIFPTELWDDSVLVFHVEQFSYEPIQPSTSIDVSCSVFPQRFVMFRRECSTWNNCHVDLFNQALKSTLAVQFSHSALG